MRNGGSKQGRWMVTGALETHSGVSNESCENSKSLSTQLCDKLRMIHAGMRGITYKRWHQFMLEFEHSSCK